MANINLPPGEFINIDGVHPLPTIDELATGLAHLISCSNCKRYKFFYVPGRDFPTLCLDCARNRGTHPPA